MLQIEGGKAVPRVQRPLQRSADDVKEDLQGGTDGGATQMTTQCGAVAPSERHVGMHQRRSLIDGDVAHQRQHLELLVQLDIPILARLGIEKRDDRVADRAEPGETAAANRLCLQKTQKLIGKYLSVLESNDKQLAFTFKSHRLESDLSSSEPGTA